MASNSPRHGETAATGGQDDEFIMIPHLPDTVEQETGSKQSSVRSEIKTPASSENIESDRISRENSPGQLGIASTSGQSSSFSLLSAPPESESAAQDSQSMQPGVRIVVTPARSENTEIEAEVGESPLRQGDTASTDQQSDGFSKVSTEPEAQEVDVPSHHSSLSSDVISLGIDDVPQDDVVSLEDDREFRQQVRDAILMVPNPDEEFIRVGQDLTSIERREFNLIGKNKKKYVKLSHYDELMSQVDQAVDFFCNKESIRPSISRIPALGIIAFLKRSTPGTIVDAAADTVRVWTGKSEENDSNEAPPGPSHGRNRDEDEPSFGEKLDRAGLAIYRETQGKITTKDGLQKAYAVIKSISPETPPNRESYVKENDRFISLLLRKMGQTDSLDSGFSQYIQAAMKRRQWAYVDSGERKPFIVTERLRKGKNTILRRYTEKTQNDLKSIFEQIERNLGTGPYQDVTVYIHGVSGTGKSLIKDSVSEIYEKKVTELHVDSKTTPSSLAPTHSQVRSKEYLSCLDPTATWKDYHGSLVKDPCAFMAAEESEKYFNKDFPKVPPKPKGPPSPEPSFMVTPYKKKSQDPYYSDVRNYDSSSSLEREEEEELLQKTAASEADHWNGIKKFHDRNNTETILKTPIGYQIGGPNFEFPIQTDRHFTAFLSNAKIATQDLAILDRFYIIEMEGLTRSQKENMINEEFAKYINEKRPESKMAHKNLGIDPVKRDAEAILAYENIIDDIEILTVKGDHNEKEKLDAVLLGLQKLQAKSPETSAKIGTFLRDHNLISSDFPIAQAYRNLIKAMDEQDDDREKIPKTHERLSQIESEEPGTAAVIRKFLADGNLVDADADTLRYRFQEEAQRLLPDSGSLQQLFIEEDDRLETAARIDISQTPIIRYFLDQDAKRGTPTARGTIQVWNKLAARLGKKLADQTELQKIIDLSYDKEPEQVQDMKEKQKAQVDLGFRDSEENPKPSERQPSLPQESLKQKPAEKPQELLAPDRDRSRRQGFMLKPQPQPHESPQLEQRQHPQGPPQPRQQPQGLPDPGRGFFPQVSPQLQQRQTQGEPPPPPPPAWPAPAPPIPLQQGSPQPWQPQRLPAPEGQGSLLTGSPEQRPLHGAPQQLKQGLQPQDPQLLQLQVLLDHQAEEQRQLHRHQEEQLQQMLGHQLHQGQPNPSGLQEPQQPGNQESAHRLGRSEAGVSPSESRQPEFGRHSTQSSSVGNNRMQADTVERTDVRRHDSKGGEAASPASRTVRVQPSLKSEPTLPREVVSNREGPEAEDKSPSLKDICCLCFSGPGRTGNDRGGGLSSMTRSSDAARGIEMPESGSLRSGRGRGTR